MACACKGRRTRQGSFIWYDPSNPEGVEPVVYKSEIEARAKVLRKPGTKYIPHDPSRPVGAQIAAAESRR